MRFTSRSKLIAVGLIVAGIAMAAGSVAHASNMGFKMNRTIVAQGAGTVGTNLVSLPLRNPYGSNPEQVCTALGLTSGSGRILRINAATGATQSDLCDGNQLVTLVQGEGIIVTNPTAAGGIIVGSHTSPFPQTIKAVGAGTIGTNLVAIPYHTTATTGEDLCGQALLTSGSGRIIRINATNGQTSSDLCDGTPLVGLVLGEAVIMTNPTDSTFSLAHF